MRRRYDRSGLLALNPQAFFEWFFDPPERTNSAAGDVAIVDIRGPLDHHAGWWCDSYDAILERVDAACSSGASAVVLRLDSPGGDASGCLETARAIREKCAAAGKKLVAYVEGQACSAGYALACAAEEISCSETGIVGSIGIINARYDSTQADKMWGYRVALTTSGDRKADGHPSNPISEAEMAATQSIVDSLAGSFFELVESLRGIPAAKVEALEAGIFHGAQAVEVGLADQVESFSALLARLASPEEGTMKGSKYDEGRAALEEAAKGEGEEAEKAKKALAAMDETDAPEEAEGTDEEPAAEGGDGDGEEKDEEKDEEAASSARGSSTVSARTAGRVGRAANTFATRLASVERQLEATERDAFLASRKDLAPAFVKQLASMPLKDVKALVNAIPKPKAKLGASAAAATPTATRGPGQGDGATAGETTDPELAAVDRAMGLAPKGPAKAAEMRGNTLYLGRAPATGK